MKCQVFFRGAFIGNDSQFNKYKAVSVISIFERDDYVNYGFVRGFSQQPLLCRPGIRLASQRVHSCHTKTNHGASDTAAQDVKQLV